MRAAWLEPHRDFEGVGAHELNPRYDHVDGGDWDTDSTTVDSLFRTSTQPTPALKAARAFALTAPAIRFDGPDISHWQADAGPINWPLLRSSAWWIATKATQSVSYVDPTFRLHRIRMGTFGHRLFYHWLSSTTSPEGQADHFVRTVGATIEGDGFMVDAEEAGVTVDKVLRFARRVEAHPWWQRPGTIYTGAYVAGGTIWQSTTVRHSVYGPRPMHLAAYTSEARARSLPGVHAYPWQAWQYSSNGPVPGVVGRCDMNRVDDRGSYDLACGYTSTPVPDPTPPPQPPDPTPTPVPPPLTLAEHFGGTDMSVFITPSKDNAQRSLWNGFVIHDVADEAEANLMIASGLVVAGTMENPVIMPAGVQARFKRV